MNDRPATGPLAEHVYRELLHAVRVGDYADRTRLPSEAEMAVRFGVSRPVLRQALERLRHEGVIHATRGSGNFVSKAQDTTLRYAPLQNISDVQRCLEFRRVIESEAAATAAVKRTAEDLDRLGAAMQRLERVIVAGEDAVDADFEFHMAVAEAANNHYYDNTLKALRGQILFGINLIRSLSANQAPARKGNVIEEHRRILEAIDRSDEDGARRAMADHLQAGMKRLFS